jgi:Mn2+/Fe2+ NRAMP family transporter
VNASLRKALGPGLLVACAAIGGSHLVWSTRAGAFYGWQLLGLLLLVNLLKYPFFLYGQRYAVATGKSLLEGYRAEGRWAIGLFLFINVFTGMINIAGVSMLSAALLQGYGLGGIALPHLTALLIAACALVVLIGHYQLLDKLAKGVISLLALLTLVAVVLALSKGAVAPADWTPPSPFTLSAFAFLIMFMGWMPAPIDLSAWSSLWMLSREEQTQHRATRKECDVDFHLGYGMAVVLAVAFLALGALVMAGSGESFSTSGIGFSRQLVSLYAASIGAWSEPIILTAAFITMLSTSLTCIDGYPRALAASTRLLRIAEKSPLRRLQLFWILLAGGGSILIVLVFVDNLIQLLGFAAIISFLTSPILAAINFRVMSREAVPIEHRPGKWLRLLSWSGLAFFFLMAAGFLATRFFN